MSEPRALLWMGAGLFLLWLRLLKWDMERLHEQFCPCGNA